MFTLVLGDNLNWTYAILRCIGKVSDSSWPSETCQAWYEHQSAVTAPSSRLVSTLHDTV